MKTLRLFASPTAAVPVSAAWYLGDWGEFRGKQGLYTRQSPQRLKTLREHALIESAVSSNRIEGVTVEPHRVQEILIAPKPLLHDRNEEEVRGYRDALALIHDREGRSPLDEPFILQLHALIRGEIWDAGRHKERDSDIIERYPDGSERVRFRTAAAADAPQFMASLANDWQASLDERWVHPLIAMAAFNLDFLCVHPFRDGNGRVSRLLLLEQCYRLGYQAGRYISLERLIEQNKERYYETLELSSQGWREGKHDPWPYINYVLSILKLAYRELVERVGEVQAPRGAKTAQIIAAIDRFSREFTLAQLEQACPGVSRDMIRRVLSEQKGKTVECLGRGPGAKWIRVLT
jgi:Fic family protein